MHQGSVLVARIRMHGGLLLGGLLLPSAVQAQPKYEFRGAWIATVANLDWPNRFDHPSTQQTTLLQMLDKLQAAGINAVFFQVRSEADAMYDSSLEPWSYWLTGRQGTPPNPFYDPLAFAIEAAHKRGMELHAWFNPYRASRGTSYTRDPSHITRAQPELVYESGPLTLMDPGKEAGRNYITSVIMDVARRYDVDGVHFDDYFYPYPPNEITTQDTSTFNAEGRGFTSLFSWRRDNVNLLVAQIADSLRAHDPYIKWGISPFGIYRNNVPEGIVGLDAYNVIFADPLAWLQAETVDYIVPQLYWPFGGDQDYHKLARWWVERISGRQLYIGHGLYRADPNTFSGTLFSADEIPNQIHFNRGYLDILGSVFFRAQNVTRYYSQDIFERLRTEFYQHPALTPPMPYKDLTPAEAPNDLAYEWTGDTEVTLTWSSPDNTNPNRYAVYRVWSAMPPDVDQASQEAANLLAITGDTTLVDYPGIAPDPYYYFVRSVSRNSIESAATTPVYLHGRATAVHNVVQKVAAHLSNYPNPFSDATHIEFDLVNGGQVTLRIFNSLGSEVLTLVERRQLNVGTHRYSWDGTDESGRRLSSGAYYILLDVEGARIVKPVVLVR